MVLPPGSGVWPFVDQGELCPTGRKGVRPARLFEESQAICQGLDFPWGIGASHYGLGEVARAQGHLSLAQRHYEQAMATFQQMGYWWGMIRVYEAMAQSAAAQGAFQEAARLFDEVEQLCRMIGVSLYLVE